MKGINFGRVILGGLVAGVVNNILEYIVNDVIMKADHETSLKALGKVMPAGGSVIASWTIMGFVFSIAAVWLYAAIRPRYGAGVGTAIRAGVAFWLFSSVFFAIIVWNLAIFPFSPMQLVLELIVAVVTTLVGAWLYREEATP